jgi:hypothetical protein
MSSVAAETRLAFERRLRAVPMSGASRPRTGSLHEAVSEKNRDIEPWEVHSELVLVCPEVCERARALLPERDRLGTASNSELVFGGDTAHPKSLYRRKASLT